MLSYGSANLIISIDMLYTCTTPYTVYDMHEAS